MPNVRLVARSGSEADVLAVYEPSMATGWTDLSGRSMLHCVLANKEPRVRVALANRLLDDGADAAALTPEGRTTAHVLLAQKRHDPPVEAPLLERLIQGGADVNHVAVGEGTPLYSLAEQFMFTDEFLAPFYDVFFALPDLDLVTPTLHARSDLDSFGQWSERRRVLSRRAQEYVLMGTSSLELRFPETGAFGRIDGVWRKVTTARIFEHEPVGVIVDRHDFDEWRPVGEVGRRWFATPARHVGGYWFEATGWGAVDVLPRSFEQIVDVHRMGRYRGERVYPLGPVIQGRVLVGLEMDCDPQTAARLDFGGDQRLDGFSKQIEVADLEDMVEEVTVTFRGAGDTVDP